MRQWFSNRIGFHDQLAWLLVGIMTCTSPGCGSSSAPATPASAKAPSGSSPATGPKLVVTGGETFNFGTTEVGQEFEHVFEVKNVGNADAVVTAGSPSCSTCTSFKIDKQVLKPQETLKATVKWHIKNENPEFRQYAPIEIENNEELKLYVVGKVVKRIVISPANVWNMGEVVDGEPKQFPATITSQVLDQFDVASVTCPNPALTVTATPLSAEKLKELKVKSGYDLNAVVDDKIPVGGFSDRVTINVQAPEAIPLVVEVLARRSGPVQIFGANWVDEYTLLNGGAFDPKQEFIARLNMFVRGVEGELKIEKVTCVDERFSIEIKADEKFQAQANGRRKYDLIVKVAPSNRAVMYTLKEPLAISIDTNQPKLGRIELKWRSAALP